jgi:oxygen-independent coproporphyrinogen-3 oxidase
VKYLGLGPAAHSFDQTSRRWNVSHNNKYIEGIIAGKPNREIETIDETTRYNEYLMTSLRTMWGLDLEYLIKEFGGQKAIRFAVSFRKYIEQGKAIQDGNFCKLTREGLFISDKIISDLFIAE